MKNTITTDINDLNTIKKLEVLGFEGSDACLETSLFEYGLIWLKGEKETLFIYGQGVKDNDCGDVDYCNFERCTIENDADISQDYDWCDWSEVLQGDNIDNFKEMPISNQIQALMTAYGFENIFGSSYGYSFDISNN